MVGGEQLPLWRRVVDLQEETRERIIAAAGVKSVEDESRRDPHAQAGWGFAQIPSLDYFYKVSTHPMHCLCLSRSSLPELQRSHQPREIRNACPVHETPISMK